MYSQPSSQAPAVAIVVLNWNGWQDTIECLDSLFRMDYPRFQVIVCDAGSTDGSLERIKAWAQGDLEFSSPIHSPIYKLETPPLPKPIPFTAYEWSSLEHDKPAGATSSLVLIQMDVNLGFAGGNNVGLRYALAQDLFQYIWVLNNDTVVHPQSLSMLVERVQRDPSIGNCGSTIFYYFRPHKIQTLGGNTYNKWLAVSKYIGAEKEPVNVAEIREERIEKQMNMVYGCAMFVSIAMLREVGLLSEDYFLFSEEIDWAERMKDRFKLGYAAKSIIYHKRGQSTGNQANPKERTAQADYYNIRSRLLFTKKYYPWALLSVNLGLLGVIFNRLRRGQFDRANTVFKIIYEILIFPKK